MSRPRCLALTKAGDQCRGRAAEGSDYCGAHGPKAGRSTKLTRTVANALEASIRNGAYNDEAAKAAGVDPRTLYRWLEAGSADEEAGTRSIFADLRHRLSRASAEAELAMVGVVRAQARYGDWRAAAWYLERRHPDKWGRRDHITHDGQLDVGKPRIVTTEAPELRAQIARVLEDAGALTTTEPGEGA